MNLAFGHACDIKDIHTSSQMSQSLTVQSSQLIAPCLKFELTQYILNDISFYWIFHAAFLPMIIKHCQTIKETNQNVCTISGWLRVRESDAEGKRKNEQHKDAGYKEQYTKPVN